MNHSIQPIDVRNSWHWNFMQFAGLADRFCIMNRYRDYPLTSCDYGRFLLSAVIKVGFLLTVALFFSYTITFTIILNIIYHFNISGHFSVVMNLMLEDLPSLWGLTVVGVTTALILFAFLATVAVGLAFAVISATEWYNDRKFIRLHKKMQEAKFEKSPTYKDSSTYKLYRSIMDKFCVPIRTE